MNVLLKKIMLLVFCTSSMCLLAQKQKSFKPKKIYKSKNLIVNQISKNAFQHISFLQTNDFGFVPCNGLIVSNNNEAIIFDTPTKDSTSNELITFIKEQLKCSIKAIIPTHFHDDCLGGLKAFHNNNIPSYANMKTIILTKQENVEVPINSINDSITLSVGNKTVFVKFFGEGHTKDNVVAYFASDNVLFGGCLVKELNATKGYLGNANVDDWSNTVEKVKAAFPSVKIVVPGHGKIGNQALLDYTIALFKVQ